MGIIGERDINKLSIDEQLKFYKQRFTYQHCKRCGNELAWGWVEFDGFLYCEDCFDGVYEEIKEIEN
jgi:hypothetical protein